MASLSKPPLLVHNHLTSSSHALIGPATLSFSKTTSLLRTRLCALKTGAGRQEADRLELLRKPVVDPVHLQVYLDGNSEEDEGEDGKWVDWEDKILEDTVPLVGFVRMILHSGKYESGDRLSPEHQKTVLERLLPFHPEAAKKIGCDIDYVTVLITSRNVSFSSSCYFGPVHKFGIGAGNLT
ncbi:hypothetical protein ACLB2K_009814 [Fragaria x ananassa]